MKINLTEVPHEGLNYQCNRQTAEFNLALQDLSGDLAHEIQFSIRPLGKGFELKGKAMAQLPEPCSLCGIDFDYKVEAQFHEILMPKQNLGRTDHFSKSQNPADTEDSGPSLIEYEGQYFDMGEYVHELVASEEPIKPIPAQDKDGNCQVCHRLVRGQSFDYNEDFPDAKDNSPFAQLKNLKIN